MSVTPGSLLVLGRRGRRPRAESPGRPVRVRLSDAERKRVELAADANHQTVSDFMRDALVTAAEDCLE